VVEKRIMLSTKDEEEARLMRALCEEDAKNRKRSRTRPSWARTMRKKNKRLDE
jgi:hypothetical protein